MANFEITNKDKLLIIFNSVKPIEIHERNQCCSFFDLIAFVVYT